MSRIHLFEFEDQQWLPEFIRNFKRIFLFIINPCQSAPDNYRDRDNESVKSASKTIFFELYKVSYKKILFFTEIYFRLRILNIFEL